MNLSILQYNEAARQYRLCLQQGPWASRFFSVALGVCSQPTCGCGEIDFTCVADDRLELNFSLDTLTQKVSTLPEGAMSAEERSLADAMVSELLQSDWKELFGLLFESKVDAIDRVDPATLDLKSPIKVDMGDGGVVTFTDVFPYGHLCGIQFGDAGWLVNDQYCVDPLCKCHEVVLSFIPQGTDATRAGKFPSVVYDYKRKKFGKTLHGLSAGMGTFKELLAKVRERNFAFDLKVENRHLKLRVLYLRSLQQSGYVPEDAEETFPRQDVGRNAPCPCGSGKKHKKCCWVPDVPD